jgi:hypothetical protein
MADDGRYSTISPAESRSGIGGASAEALDMARRVGTEAAANAAAAAEAKKKAQEEDQAIGGRDAVSDQAAAGGDVNDEEIYDTYVCRHLREGKNHPDHIVETTTLSLIDPPEITYQHHLQQVAQTGALSSPQLETVIYAQQRYESYPACKENNTNERPGFFLGDGAGVGKGRQIAGIIFENHAIGVKRFLWLSVSSDLHYDAERDLKDVAEGTDLPELNLYPKKTNTGTIQTLSTSSTFAQQGIGNGVLFCTYSLLMGAKAGCNTSVVRENKFAKERREAQEQAGQGLNPRPGLMVNAMRRGKLQRAEIVRRSHKTGQWKVRFVLDNKSKDLPEYDLEKADNGETAAAKETENERIFDELCKKGTRLEQIIGWLKNGKGDDADPVIILDECHKAKNLSEGGLTSSSKTALVVLALQRAIPGARVLYCSATGAAEPESLGYMVRLGSAGFESTRELLTEVKEHGMGAMEIFAMGLKAQGAYTCRTLSYKGAEFECVNCPISDSFQRKYDRASEWWQLLFRVFESANKAVGPKGGLKWAQFWGSHMRFFRQMLIAAKVPALAKMAKKAERKGMAVVIGLQQTGEANTKQALDVDSSYEADGFVSAPHMVLKNLIESQFPIKSKKGYEGHIGFLHLQVRQSIRSWRQASNLTHGKTRQAGPAERSSEKFQAREEERERRHAIALSRRRARERSAQFRHGFGTGGTSFNGGSGAGAMDDDEDSDIEMETARTLDEVLKDKFETAARTGEICDVDGADDNVMDEDLEEDDKIAGIEKEERRKEREADARSKGGISLATTSARGAAADIDVKPELGTAEGGIGRRSRNVTKKVNYCEIRDSGTLELAHCFMHCFVYSQWSVPPFIHTTTLRPNIQPNNPHENSCDLRNF